MIGIFVLSLTGLFVVLETVEHCLYRVGSRRVAASPFIIGAIALNLVGMGIWLAVLRTAALGQVLPLLAATNVTTAFAGRFLFNERVSVRRWIGIALITFGVSLVSSAIL